MAGIFEITEGLVSDHEFKRFQHMEDHSGIYGVWDFERKAWRSQPSYTCREAATMSGFLNRQDKPGGLSRLGA